MSNDSAILAAFTKVGMDAQPGEFARAIRLELNLSLKEVAERMGNGTHFTTISKLEKGTMLLTYSWAKSLAAIYDIPASVLHMPYEALNSARRVPVFRNLQDVNNRGKVAPDSFTGFISSSDNLFGYSIIAYPDIVSNIALYTAIIDPSRSDLHPGGVYLLEFPELTDGVIGIYRDEGEYRCLIPYPKAGDPIIIEECFQTTVHGEVIELQRTLASRNR